jgi:hypothetical protein
MGVKIQLFEIGAYKYDFCLCGWMKSEVYKEKVNTREFVARIMNIAALIKHERQDTSGELHVLLPREMKSALNSMVGFLSTYFEPLQLIEIIYITDKCSQQNTSTSTFIRKPEAATAG